MERGGHPAYLPGELFEDVLDLAGPRQQSVVSEQSSAWATSASAARECSTVISPRRGPRGRRCRRSSCPTGPTGRTRCPSASVTSRLGQVENVADACWTSCGSLSHAVGVIREVGLLLGRELRVERSAPVPEVAVDLEDAVDAADHGARE